MKRLTLHRIASSLYRFIALSLHRFYCPALHIWFRLIEAHFAAAGIKSQKLKYANALASLPKQVLRDILDTIDVCNDSDEPFDSQTINQCCRTSCLACFHNVPFFLFSVYRKYLLF
jgi:hypothetical protein